MWRRICGGLTAGRQQELWAYLEPHLARGVHTKAAKNIALTKGIKPEGLDEMVRLAAGLEHLAVTTKGMLGGWIADRLRAHPDPRGPWTWALGRVGARTPIFGSVHNTLPPETVTEWVLLLLQPEKLKLDGALFAVTQMARLTGDRTRDLEPDLRAQVMEGLRAAEASPSWQRMVAELVVLEAADKARALGDTLPVGLSLA